MGGVGQLHQQVTIGSLPDDVLLKIFKTFVDATKIRGSPSEKWHTLVHVCRSWRYLAFTSPRHLNLQLLCKPPRRSVKEMLDIWPELPIYIHAIGYLLGVERDDFLSAFRLNHRVSTIRLDSISGSEREGLIAPLVQRPFPALTHLWVQPRRLIRKPISRSFLGGFAPCLQVLHLDSFSFPALPSLLLSATNLVCLSYTNIPSSGYIPPQAMVTGLSALTRLRSLFLKFRPKSPASSEIRIPPSHTRTLLPALTDLHFLGVPEYMKDLVIQIDAPLLESTNITFFHQEVVEVPGLSKFVRRSDKLSSVDRADVAFGSDRISAVLSQELQEIVDSKTLRLYLDCHESDLRLSYLAQFCAPCLPTLSPFEYLYICVSPCYRQEDVMYDLDRKWLDLLHLFNTVKKLYLSEFVAPRVAQALRGLPAERVMEVLPALETVSILGLKHLEPVKEAISEFADPRRLSGHPVFIRDWGGVVHYWESQGNGSRG